MRLFCALALAGLVGACASIAKPVKTTVLSLAQLDCGECGKQLAKKLAEQDGVYRAKFDLRRAELSVESGPSVDVLAEARRLSHDEKFELVLGAGQGRYLDPPPVPPAADVAWIAQNGEDVADLAAHRVRGKVTVIDFGAAWCEPCRQLDEHVIAIAATRSDLAYRKLDIGDWDTPLAKHYLERVPALPYVIVYGKSGHQIDAFSRLDLKRLDRAIEDGAQP